MLFDEIKGLSETCGAFGTAAYRLQHAPKQQGKQGCETEQADKDVSQADRQESQGEGRHQCKTTVALALAETAAVTSGDLHLCQTDCEVQLALHTKGNAVQQCHPMCMVHDTFSGQHC